MQDIREIEDQTKTELDEVSTRPGNTRSQLTITVSSPIDSMPFHVRVLNLGKMTNQFYLMVFISMYHCAEQYI